VTRLNGAGLHHRGDDGEARRFIEGNSEPSSQINSTIQVQWATTPMLPQALRVMSAWGFTYWGMAVGGEAGRFAPAQRVAS
jgi:hypothetical protein